MAQETGPPTGHMGRILPLWITDSAGKGQTPRRALRARHSAGFIYSHVLSNVERSPCFTGEETEGQGGSARTPEVSLVLAPSGSALSD